MNLSQFLRLLFTSAIWGASHVGSRVVVPAVGPWLTVFGRLIVAFITLSILLTRSGELRSIGQQWSGFRKHFLIVGLTNFAFPFSCFAVAAIHLPAAYLVILNATVPIFSAILSSIFMKEPFDWRRWLSIGMGITGVTLLTEYGSIVEITSAIAGSIVLGLLASLSYAAGGLYIRMKCKGVPPPVLVWGSTMLASSMLSIFALYSGATHGEFHSDLHSWWTIGIWLLLLGSFSSGIAFVVYYGLVGEIGIFNASLTTFVMPMFGLMWGMVLLGETVTIGMAVGAALVIGSAALFVRRNYKK